MKTPLKILIIDQNAVFRSALREALELEGLAVLEADSGAAARRILAAATPNLVLQSLVMPDCDASGLATELKRLRSELSIIALAGFLSHAEEARILDTGFDDVLTKPIDPSRLVAVVRTHLAALSHKAERFGDGRKIVVADDDPMQLKLTRIRLEQLGFQVLVAADGGAALALAESEHPDAIVTDALMPRVDGFELCVRVRRSASIGRLPIVLVTSSYLEDEDRELGQRMGANAFVARTPSLDELIEALHRVLRQPLRESVRMRAVSMSAHDLAEERLVRVSHQLERQVARNTGLAQRYAALAAERSVLSAISDALVRAKDKDEALRGLLADCLDAAGLLRGAIYVVDPNGKLTLRAQAGPGSSGFGPLGAFARQPELVRAALDQGVPIEIPSSALLSHRARGDRISEGAEATVLVMPLRLADETLGALALVTSGRDLGKDWHDFVRALAAQVSVALALLRSFVAVTRSEQRYRALLDSAQDAIFIGDRAGLIQEANQTAQRLLGQSRTELLTRSIFKVIPEATASWPRPEALRPSTARSFSSELTRRDGSVVQVETSLSFIEDGADVLFMAIVRDVTAQRALEGELRQAQKMEAIGHLAGGVAHDFNNLLAVITSYSDLLTADLDEGDPRRADVTEIRDAAERAAGLTRQLLAFSRRQVVQPKTLDLNELVAGTEKLLRRVIGEHIQLKTKLAELPQTIYADPVQVEQIVINLVVNARDAMPNGGTVIITTSEIIVDAALITQHPVTTPTGRYARLSVIDTGEGMSPETQARIFEPFFTTKPAGQGTGLGLSTVYGIVQQCHGAINVHSALGAGATFEILLPCADEPSAGAPKERAAAPNKGASETILLVEDSPAIRRATARILERSGYAVLEAPSGLQAMVICKEYPAQIHLLLTDVIMPGLDGRAVAKAIAKLRPAIKVLYMSGNASGGGHGAAALDAPMIKKPFTAAALAGKVREILESFAEDGA